MQEMIQFSMEQKFFIILMFCFNLFLVRKGVIKYFVLMNRSLIEASGGRYERVNQFKNWTIKMKYHLGRYKFKRKDLLFYKKAQEKMKRAGYHSDYAAALYLCMKFAAPLLCFAISFVVNFPEYKSSLVSAMGIFAVVEFTVYKNKRKMIHKFNRNIYKIYKYLHNQISAGVKPTDAIKTVYLIIEDEDLKKILIQLAARYELTLNIEKSLEEFQSNFDLQEAETLCVALRQGIETGDNQELLSRQEQFMFNQYFNYIQAETESCRTRGTISVLIFASIIIIMIVLPLINDVMDASAKIFVQ